jgi:hypothetical protein
MLNRDIERTLAGIHSPGELNYVLTRTVVGYLYAEGENYTAYAIVHGVLGDVWDEIRRRLKDAYEDRKCAENGDVF